MTTSPEATKGENIQPSVPRLLVRDSLEADYAKKDLDNIQPIDYATVALKHPAVYNMHRYFARRPHNVFQNLIRHYTNPKSMILDPFCGGGVTVIEALREKRKVVAVDFNPLATFITRMEVTPVDLKDFQKAFDKIKRDVSQKESNPPTEKNLSNLRPREIFLCILELTWLPWFQLWRILRASIFQVFLRLPLECLSYNATLSWLAKT
jgi:hypothetical protein